MPWLVGVDDWLASYGTEQRKIEFDPISTQRKNGYGSFLPFTAAIFLRNFTELQRNFTTAERRNCN